MGAQIRLEDSVCWSEEQVFSQVDGEIALMNIQRGYYYSLDDIGSRIWRSLKDPIKVANLCRELSTEYNADEVVIRRDVLAFLDRLAENNLIRLLSESLGRD